VLDHKTTLAALPADLGATLKLNDPSLGDPHGQQALVRADKDVSYETFMAVVGRLKNDGYKRIGLINEDIS
jgi:biopolymer transport protein ExbD